MLKRLCSPKRKKKNRVYPRLPDEGDRYSISKVTLLGHGSKTYYSFDDWKELAELRDELQKAEDLRFEHEEEMWRLHELHKSEIAEQRRVLESLHGAEVQEHRQVLTVLMDEHERSQVEAELDIEEAKRRLTEDARAEYDKVTKEIERLKAVMGDDTGPAVLVTCSEPNLTQTGAAITVSAGTAASAAAGPLSPHLPASKSVQVVGTAAGAADLFGLEMFAKLSSSTDVSESGAATERFSRKEKLTRMFLATSEKLGSEKRKLKEKEKRFREIGSEQLEKVSKQSELIKRLQHRQKKLLKFIEEREPVSPEDIRAEPIGESCSEESLLSASSYTKQTTSTRLKQQGKQGPLSDVSSSLHRKMINQARADFFNRPPTSLVQQAAPHHPKMQRAGSLPPSITVTPVVKEPHSHHHPPQRSRSEEKSDSNVSGKFNKSRTKKSPSPTGTTKHGKTSSIAQQVTSRLYNPEKIRQQFEAKFCAKKQTAATKQAPKPPKIPLRLLERHPTVLHTRSRSAPSLHVPYPSDRRKNNRGPRRGNSREDMNAPQSPVSSSPSTDQVFWPSQEDFQYSMGSLEESREELDTIGPANVTGHDRFVEDRLGPVGGSDGSGNDSPRTSGPHLSIPVTSATSTAIPQHTAIPVTHHSALNTFVPKDITDAKIEHFQSHFSANNPNQDSQIDSAATNQSRVVFSGGDHERGNIESNTVRVSCEQSSNNNSVHKRYTLPSHSETPMETDTTTDSACIAEAQKRTQNDPPSDSDVSVSKQLKEDPEPSKKDDTEMHLAENVTDPNMDICVNTELHKEYQTSSETLSPLSPMEEEYTGSGSGKRLSDSGYNTTGVYLSEENLSLRSRGHTLKDVETFSEDSLDNLIEANDSLDETGQTIDDDTTSNIEQLKQYFQEQNEFDDREEVEKHTEIRDGESCAGHISQDSLEESVYGISKSDRLRLEYSSPQLHFNENSTDNERFAQSLPVSLIDHKVPNMSKQSQGLNYPEQLLQNQWQPYLHTASDEEDKPTNSGQYPEKQLGPVDSNNDTLEVQSALKQIFNAENQCAATEDEVSPNGAGCTDSRESLDENDNHLRLSSQKVSPKHTLVPENLHGILDQKENFPGYDQSQFEDDNVVEPNRDLEQNSREFVDADVTQECIREDIADALMGENNDVIMEDNNVISYMGAIGAGDSVNVLALDGKNGTSVYVITDGNLPLTGEGDGPDHETSYNDFPKQCLTQMSDDRKSDEELESRSRRDDNKASKTERMEMNIESLDGGGHESAEPDDSLHSIPPLPINRHDDLPEVPPVPLQLSDNEAIPSPSAKVSPPASPIRIAHRMSPLIQVPSEPLLNPSTSFVNTNSSLLLITSPRSPRRQHRPWSARSVNSQHDDDSSTSDESTHVTMPRSRPTSGRRRTRTQERRRSSSGSNSCVSTDHESSYSEDESLKISDDAPAMAADNEETSIVSFYVASSSTTSDEDQGGTLVATDNLQGAGKGETPGSDIVEDGGSGAGVSSRIRPSDEDSEINDVKKSKLPTGSCDDAYKLQKVEDEPVFSPRKSCAQLLPSGSDKSRETAEKITRTISVNEGDCEMVDIESEGSYTETDGSNAAVEITQLNKTGSCTDTPNDQNELTKLLHLESKEQEVVASKPEHETKDYSDDFDSDNNSSNDGNMKHELSSPPPDVTSRDSENDNVVDCCDEPLSEHGNIASAHGVSGLETCNTSDTSEDTEDGTCDSTDAVGENVNSNMMETVPSEQVTPVTNTASSNTMSDEVAGKKIVQTKDVKLKTVAELTSKVEILVDESSDVSEAKDYSDDFDSTDSHGSWDAVNRLKFLNAPIETVQMDSELDMAVSDHDEPLMKLETLNDDLNNTVVKVTITDNSENERKPFKDAIGEVLAETIAEIGLPRHVVTSVESGGVGDVQENRNDTICEDKNLMDDGVGKENALNINMEEIKTNSEMEVETNDQECLVTDLTTDSLVQGENSTPILHKPPTHPDSSHGNTWPNIWVAESGTNDTDEYEYIDDFDSDSKGYDDTNNLKVPKLPVEVVNTDSELELATSDHEEPLMDLSTASGELKHNDSVEKMQRNIICTSSNTIEMCQDVRLESELPTTMEELIGSQEGEVQNDIERKLVDDVMSLVTIPSVALSDECEEGNDQDMYSDDFDSDSKSLEENITQEGHSKLKLLDLPTEIVATDSEMEIATSDQEEPLMNLTPESHDVVVREPKANRDSDDDDMDQFSEGISNTGDTNMSTNLGPSDADTICKTCNIMEIFEEKESTEKIFGFKSVPANDTNFNLNIEATNIETEETDTDDLFTKNKKSEAPNESLNMDKPENDLFDIKTAEDTPEKDLLTLSTVKRGMKLTLQIPEGDAEYQDDIDSSGSSSLSTSSTSGVLVVNPEGSVNPTETLEGESTTPGSEVADLVTDERDRSLEDNPTVEYEGLEEKQEAQLNWKKDQNTKHPEHPADVSNFESTEHQPLGNPLQENTVKVPVTSVTKCSEDCEDLEAPIYLRSGGYRASLLDSEATGATSETQTLETESDIDIGGSDIEPDETGSQDELGGIFTVSASSNLETVNEPKTPEEVLKFIGIIEPKVSNVKRPRGISQLNLTMSKPDVWNSVLINSGNTLFPIVETQVSEPKDGKSALKGSSLKNGEALSSTAAEEAKQDKQEMISRMDRAIAECWNSGTFTDEQSWKEPSTQRTDTKFSVKIINGWDAMQSENDEDKNNQSNKLGANIDKTDKNKPVDNGTKWQSELEHHQHSITGTTTPNKKDVGESKTIENRENCANEYIAENKGKRKTNFGSENELESLDFNFVDFDVKSGSAFENTDSDWERPIELNKSKENKLLKSVNGIDSCVNSSSRQEEYDLQGSPPQNTGNRHSIDTTGVLSRDVLKYHITQEEEVVGAHSDEVYDHLNEFSCDRPEIKDREAIKRDHKVTVIRLTSVEENVIGLDLHESMLENEDEHEKQHIGIDSDRDQLNELIEQTKNCFANSTETVNGQAPKDSINAENQHQIHRIFTTCEDELETQLSSDLAESEEINKKTIKDLKPHKKYTDITCQDVIIDEIRDREERGGIPLYGDSNTGDNNTRQVCAKDEQPLISREESNAEDSEELFVPGLGPFEAGSQVSTSSLNNIEDPQLEINDTEQQQSTDLHSNEDKVQTTTEAFEISENHKKSNQTTPAADKNDETSHSQWMVVTEETKDSVTDLVTPVGSSDTVDLTSQKLIWGSKENTSVNVESHPAFYNTQTDDVLDSPDSNKVVTTDRDQGHLNEQNYYIYVKGNYTPTNSVEDPLQEDESNNCLENQGQQTLEIQKVNSIGNSQTGQGKSCPQSDTEYSIDKSEITEHGAVNITDVVICEEKVKEVLIDEITTEERNSIKEETHGSKTSEFDQQNYKVSGDIDCEDLNRDLCEAESVEEDPSTTFAPQYDYSVHINSEDVENFNDAVTDFVAEVINNAKKEVITAQIADQKDGEIVRDTTVEAGKYREFELNDTVSSAISELIGQLLDRQFSDSDDYSDSDSKLGNIELDESDPEKGNVSLDVNSSLKDVADEGQIEHTDSFLSDLSELEFTPRSEISSRTYDSESITSYDSWFDGGARFAGPYSTSRDQFVTQPTVPERVRTASVLTAASSVDWTSSSSSSESGVSELESQQQLEALCDADIKAADEVNQAHCVFGEETDLGQADLFLSSASVIENEVFSKRPKLQKSEAVDDEQSRQTIEVCVDCSENVKLPVRSTHATDLSDSSLDESHGKLFTSEVHIILNIPSGANNGTEEDIQKELEQHPDHVLEFTEEQLMIAKMDDDSKKEREDESQSEEKYDGHASETMDDHDEQEVDIDGAIGAEDPQIQVHVPSRGELPRRTSTPTPGGQRDTVSAVEPGLLGFVSPRMGDSPSADPEGASGGGRSGGKRDHVVQTVQSPATVQSEDEGYDTLMPVYPNLEHDIHDETLDSIADIVHDSGRTSPATRAHQTADERATNTVAQEPAESGAASAEGTVAVTTGAQEIELSGAVSRILAPGEFISIEMSDGGGHVVDDSQPSTSSGNRDPGTYRLVHFKSPEPHSKSKRPKLDPDRAEQLGPSEYVNLDTTNLAQAMRELPKASDQGVVELTDGAIRPAEINMTLTSDIQHPQDITQKRKRPARSSTEDPVMNGSTHVPATVEMNNDDHVNTASEQLSADKQSQSNSINGNFDDLGTNVHLEPVHLAPEQNETANDIVSADGIRTDVTNAQTLKLTDGAHDGDETKTKSSSISKSKPVQHAEQFGDTDIVSVIVPPGKPAPQTSESVTNTEKDARQEILMLSKSTVRHPSSNDSANSLNNEGSGSVTENEFQVIGIQPLPKEQEHHVEKLPEQVLREHPEAPCYHNLRHSELNIEIRPWKVSDVRTSVTTEVASQQNGVTDSGDKVIESSGDDDEEEMDSAGNSSEVNDDDIETPVNEVTSSDMNVAGQNVMAEIVPNDSNNNSFSSSPDGSHLKVTTSETDVCENVEETSCEELRTCEGTCNFDGITLPSEEILRNNNSETAENEHNAVARMIAQRMLSDLIADDKNDTSGGTTMSEENALEHNVVEEAIDTEMVSQSMYAINDTSELSNVEDSSSVNVTSDTNLDKESNNDLVTSSKDTALTNSDVSGPIDGICSSENVESEDIDSIVNENNAVAQMIADKMLSEQHHSPEQSTDVSILPADGKPERSSTTSQKRDQIDAALVDSDDEQSPAKVQKVSRSLMLSEENVDKRLDQIDTPTTALADVEEVMSEVALLSDVEKSEIEGKTDDLETGREESNVIDEIKESEVPERQHVDLAQVLETFEDLPHGTTVHVMHQVECLAEQPEKGLLADGDLANRTSTSDGAGETMTPPTKSNLIISVDDEAGTSADPQDHEPTTGEDETDLIPVDSDGPRRPGSVVKGTSGESKDKAWKTIEETEMLEKVITAERAGMVVVDEVDTVNVDSDGEDAGKATAVSKSDMDVPAPNDRCKQQELSDTMKAQPHENGAIDEGMPLSVESEIGLSAIRAQHEERRPIAAVQPRQSQAQPDIERRDAEDILLARETGSTVTERHDGSQSPVLGHHPSNMDSTVPLEHDLEETDFAEEQPMNTGIGSTAQVSEVTAEEDVRVELLESPRRNIEHKEHIPSPRGRELHQPIVVRQISEGLTYYATKVEDEGRNSTTHQRENDEGTYNAFQEAQLIGNEEITEEELARFRGVNLRGRSVTPMRHTRPGSHRRSRSLSLHALEDAFFKMAEADSRKCLVESAIQTDPLSSASSSSKSSPKHRLKQSKGSPRLTHGESSSNTSRSISPIDSSSESSALVQQALATIRSAMETKTEYCPQSMRSPTERSGEEQQQICQNTVQKREEVSGRTENVCLQTGESLDDIPAATEAPEEIVDQTFEPELEHSSVLLQDPNSSDQIASSDSNEHLDHLDAAENLNSDMPSSIVPRSSTPTSSEEIYPCQHVDHSLTQEEGRTRDQASGIDTTFVPEVLEDQQESYESTENSDAITVVSVSVGRVDPMQNTVLAAQTITDVPSEVLEAASGQRSFAVQAGDGDEGDGDVTSGDAVDSSEGHQSFAVQVTGLDNEVDVRTIDDLSIPENVLDFSDHLESATGHRSMAIQAFDPEEVEAVRSFGVQVFVQDLGRPTTESDNEQQRPVTGSRPLSEALEVASNTNTDNHPPFTSGVENMNSSIVSDLGRGEISSLSTAHTRTIETQTYPELRVIETQTSLDMHGMETQTSPKELVEGEATQTEVLDMEEISVQTPAEMAISVIDPEMILYHSATNVPSDNSDVLCDAAESGQLPAVLPEEISCDKAVNRQPTADASLEAPNGSNVEAGNVADDVEIEISRSSNNSSGEDAVLEPHFEDIRTEKELKNIILSPEDAKNGKEDHPSISELDLNNVDLETLKAEHKKLLEMFKKSKEKADRRIKDRKALQDRTRKVEGWIDSNLDELHDDENEMKATGENVNNKDTSETLRGSSGSEQPESVTYFHDSSGSQMETLSDETFLTGAFLGKAERPLPNAPNRSPEHFSDGEDSSQHLVTAEQRASSTSPPSQESHSPISSESESLITVKEATPVRKLTGSSGSPTSLTSSAESFVTAVSNFDANRKNNQSTSSAADISVESYSTADNEVPIENLEHSTIKALMGKDIPSKAIEVACPMAEKKDNSGSSHKDQISLEENIKNSVPELLETGVPCSSETLDISDCDIPSNDSSRLSEYGIHLDTSSESNQGSIGSPMSTWFIPPEPINIQGSVDLYDSPVVEDVILKHDAPRRQKADANIFSKFGEAFPNSNREMLPRDPRSEVEGMSEEPRLQELEQLIRQQDESVSPDRDDTNIVGTLSKDRPVPEPVPVATSSPTKPSKSSAAAVGADNNDVLYKEELNVSLDSPVVEDKLLRETSAPRRPDSTLDRRINQVITSVDNFTVKSPAKENVFNDDDTVRISASGGDVPQELRDGNYSVPRVVLDSETDPQKGSSYDTADTLVDGISSHSPGTLRKCVSDSTMATSELEVPKTGDLDISASSSIEDWTQTEDLGSSWTRGVGFADSGTDPDNNDLLDELERLRRERQRILDMLAKDLMPSKLQVELAEAQLNYIIGQTDTLLQTLDQSELDTDTLLELSLPDAQLKSITNQYMSQYKASLEMSKKQIELKISMLEKEKDRSGRIRQRSRKLAQVRRQAELEAFKLERQREQVNYERQKLMPRSRSDSPRCRSQEELRTESPDPNAEIPLAPIYARYMTPKQMQKHLSKLRKGLIQSNKKRPQSASPARTTSSSLLSGIHSPSHSSLGPAPWRDYSSIYNDTGAYDLYSPHTLSPATSLQSGMSSAGQVPPLEDPLGYYGRETAERYGYDLHTIPPQAFHGRPGTPPSSRTSSRSPPRQHHHGTSQQYSPRGLYATPPLYSSVRDARYYPSQELPHHDATYYNAQPPHYVPGVTPGGARPCDRYYASSPHPTLEGASHGAPGYCTSRHAASYEPERSFSPRSESRHSGSAYHIGGPRDFGVGGSISSLGSSLDEDSERLLSEYQLARSRAEAEIQRARQTLQLPHKPTATYSRPGTSPLVTAEYKSVVQSQPQTDKPASVTDRTKIEKEIDSEIEQLKKKYGEIAKDVNPRSLTYRSSYGSETRLSTWSGVGRMTESYRPMPRPSNILDKYRTGAS